MGSDFGEGGDGAFDFFFCDELELAVGFGVVGLGYDVDDVEDIDATLGGEILAADEGRSDGYEFAPFVGVFGNFEAHCFDAHDCFCGIEDVPGFHGSERISQSSWIQTYVSTTVQVLWWSNLIDPWSTCGLSEISDAKQISY